MGETCLRIEQELPDTMARLSCQQRSLSVSSESVCLGTGLDVWAEATVRFADHHDDSPATGPESPASVGAQTLPWATRPARGLMNIPGGASRPRGFGVQIRVQMVRLCPR